MTAWPGAVAGASEGTAAGAGIGGGDATGVGAAGGDTAAISGVAVPAAETDGKAAARSHRPSGTDSSGAESCSGVGWGAGSSTRVGRRRAAARDATAAVAAGAGAACSGVLGDALRTSATDAPATWVVGGGLAGAWTRLG